MGWGNNNPRNPNAPCPPNNPHCQGLPEAVSIQSDVLTIILVLAILVYVLWIFKNRKV